MNRKVCAYCEITIVDVLLTSIVVLAQKGTLMGYGYVTTTSTMFPGALHATAQAVQPVEPVVFARSHSVVTTKLRAFRPGYRMP